MTYANYGMADVSYRGLTLAVLSNEGAYFRSSGRACRWLWVVKHPTQQGRYMTCKTLEGCKAIVDALHKGTVAWPH